MSTTMDISEARQNWSSLPETVRDARVIRVRKHGKDAFAVVDIEYLEAVMETIEIMSDPEAYQSLLRGLEDLRNGHVVDHDDAEREIFGD